MSLGRSEVASIRAVHTIGSIASRHGGPSRSVPALCRALEAIGVDITLLSRETSVSRSLSKTIRAHVSPGQLALLHDHGMWLPSNHAAATYCRRAGIRRIV